MFFKFLLIYGLFIFIRTVIRGFKFVRVVKGAVKDSANIRQEYSYENQESRQNSVQRDEVYEAKCTVKEEE
jgi:hypothetical protein